MTLLKSSKATRLACCALFALLGLALGAVHAAPLEFHLTFDPKISPSPFTGRVFVYLSSRQMTKPPEGPDWFHPQPFFAQDVKNWKPSESISMGADSLGFPMPLAKMSRGAYWVMAVMDLDRGERSFSAAPGNGFSKPVRLELDPGESGPVRLTLDQVVPERRFVDNARVKLVDMESKLLSEFHGRSVHLRAGVVLPRSFAESPPKRYAVIYEIPGFGGNHFMAHYAADRGATDVAGMEMLYVVLDPSCRLGHHVFADSENNGPCGKALVEELIPAIENKFRSAGTPGARLLTGHSSGGWSSLWLQVTYPDFFGGVWSTAPDPVDFRDFQRIDIYKPGANMFTDDAGKPRPLARIDGKPVLFFKPFSDMEVVMGHGGQLGSFEAVFSPRGPDGKPEQLWDRKTGNIDPGVARSWEKFDIRLVLEKNWSTIGPKLAGKLHVYTGGADTFYLDGATALLKDALTKVGSDAVVEIFPGRDHATVMDRALRQRIAREMADTFRKNVAK